MTHYSVGEGKDEREPCLSTLNFPFLPMPAATMLSPQHRSGKATPPLQTSASVPFKWEEQPGKPLPCTDIIVRPEPAKCLELPPCRMLVIESTNKVTKMPSPTTVLDGPYNLGRPKFSSFRLFSETRRSFDGSSPQCSLDVLLGKKKKTKGFFPRSLRLRSSRKGVDESSFGFSHISRCSSVKMEGEMGRHGSFSSFSAHSASTNLWVAVRESLKRAMPWKSKRKSKKEGACLMECDI